MKLENALTPEAHDELVRRNLIEYYWCVDDEEDARAIRRVLRCYSTSKQYRKFLLKLAKKVQAEIMEHNDAR